MAPNRSERTSIRLRPHELALLRSSAEASGMHLAEFIRTGALKEATRVLAPAKQSGD